MVLDRSGAYQFFRLKPEIEDTGVDADGGDLFGYNRIFEEELTQAGYLSPEGFAAANQASPDYLSDLCS